MSAYSAVYLPPLRPLDLLAPELEREEDELLALLLRELLRLGDAEDLLRLELLLIPLERELDLLGEADDLPLRELLLAPELLRELLLGL